MRYWYVKKTETPEETLIRLARDAREGTGAAKCFEKVVKRAAKTPSPTAESKTEESADA